MFFMKGIQLTQLSEEYAKIELYKILLNIKKAYELRDNSSRNLQLTRLSEWFLFIRFIILNNFSL